MEQLNKVELEVSLGVSMSRISENEMRKLLSGHEPRLQGPERMSGYRDHMAQGNSLGEPGHR